MLFKNGTIFTENAGFEKLDILTEGDRIAKIGAGLPADGHEVLDCTGKTLLPGFVDIHSHGCGGHDFCDGTEEAMQAMANTYAKAGVTSVLATSMTLPIDYLEKVFGVFRSYVEKPHTGARYLGINMEGPYLSKEKKGAHDERYLIAPTMETFTRLNNACGGNVRLVDVAPELEGAEAFIRQASKVCAVSVAHTNAGYELIKESFDWGITNATHLYNAMSAFSHRSPGAVGAIFDSDVYAEVICDGIHSHPAVIRATFKELGDDRVVFVSDSMQAAGMPEGKYDLGGQTVYVKDGKATLEDGTIAGSVIDSSIAVKRAISFGVPAASAIKAATINPAKDIGVFDKVGSLSEGKFADILVTSGSYELEQVFVGGKKFEAQ